MHDDDDDGCIRGHPIRRLAFLSAHSAIEVLVCVLPNTNPNPVCSGGTASLWDQGGEAQPLPGAAGAVPPEAAARGGPGRLGAHPQEPGQVQHALGEDQGDGLQGEHRTRQQQQHFIVLFITRISQVRWLKLQWCFIAHTFKRWSGCQCWRFCNSCGFSF